MIYLIFSYFGYNFLIGIIMVVLFSIRRARFNFKDIMYVLFFPSVGVGKMIYKNKVATEDDVLPEDWFIYKYMLWVHGAYVAGITVGIWYLVFYFSRIVSSRFGAGDDFRGLSEGLGVAAIQLGMMVFAFFINAIIALIFIYIPFHYLKELKKELEEKKNSSPSVPNEGTTT